MLRFSYRAYTLISILALIPEGLTQTALIPLMPFLTAHVLKMPIEKIGAYSGILSAVYWLPMALNSLLWGLLSDKIGRKPVLYIGLTGFLLSFFLLIFAPSFTVLATSQFLGGFFACNSSIVKGLIGDMSQYESDVSRNWGFAIYAALYSSAQIISPLMAARLYDPASLFPSRFGNSEFMKKYPLFLIGCVIGATMIPAYIAIFLLAETRGKNAVYHLDKEDKEMFTDLKNEKADATSADVKKTVPELPYSSERKVFGLPISAYGPHVVYCFVTFAHLHYLIVNPLYYASPVGTPGLGLAKTTLPLLSVVAATTKLITQLFLFPLFVKMLHGIRRTFQLGIFIWLPIFASIPLTAKYSANQAWIVSIFNHAILGIGESLGYLSCFIWITSHSPPEYLGLAHGLSSSFAAAVRTIAGFEAGTLWQWGITHGIYWIPYAVTASSAFIALVLSLRRVNFIKDK